MLRQTGKHGRQVQRTGRRVGMNAGNGVNRYLSRFHTEGDLRDFIYGQSKT
ncbi:MAG: hypothetical protein HY578_04250 [Nitrospinae bacterium]|nr:hypothetical protein [Nitrospinota bacterium]